MSIRTVTFKSVLYGAARRHGLDPARADLTQEQADSITEYINAWLEQFWFHGWWPEWTYTEERQYRADWSENLTYIEGDEVYLESTDTYYRALAADKNSYKNPAVETSYWEVASDLDKYVARDQAWETNEIGMAVAAWKNNPRISDTPYPLTFRDGPNGIEFDKDAPSKVWLRFLPPAPVFTATPWNATDTYPTGSIVYYTTNGECYINNTGLTIPVNEAPTTNTYWTKIDFPAILAQPIKMATRADMLREDDQMTAADKAEDRAWERLIHAYDRVSIKEGGNTQATVRTR
jgi:hypothetical protein